MLSKHTRVRLIARNGKKVRAHRWIMEQHIGRKLRLDEHIHHINGNPLDNRISNLQIVDVVSHNRMHKQKYADVKACVVCGDMFQVNPRKRSRNKCCSAHCAMVLRVAGRKRQSERSKAE